MSNSPTERMRITPLGVLVVGGTTAALAGSTLCATAASIPGQAPLTIYNTTASSAWWVGPDQNANFLVFNASGVGVYLASGGTTWTSYSDERLKTNLTPILDGLAKVNSLRSVTGRFKTDEIGKSRAFLIAQDVQKVFPEAVTTSDPENLGLAYTDVIPLLVAAIKELNAKVDAQTKRITDLEEQVLNLGTK
jgi:hypothetical protein